MTISARLAALFGYGGPNAYFPAVWFVEDETTVEEELRPEYRGNGGAVHPAWRDPFSDATDADIERLVRDKWEVVEAAQQHEHVAIADDAAATEGAADQNQIKNKNAAPVEDRRELVMPMPGNYQEILGSSTVASVSPGADMQAALMIDEERKRRQESADIALILALLEA